MNSEYHKLPVSKAKKRIYKENKEAKKPLHIEGGSSCTDAERLKQEKINWIISWAEEHSEEEINLLIFLYQSSLQD